MYLVGVSRLLDRPLAAICLGLSSSGKSWVIERTSQLFPPETTLLATQMTPQALFYMPAGSLSHRFVVAGERSRNTQDDAAEATRALREMLSSGRLSKLIPIKNNGSFEAQRIEQELHTERKMPKRTRHLRWCHANSGENDAFVVDIEVGKTGEVSLCGVVTHPGEIKTIGCLVDCKIAPLGVNTIVAVKQFPVTADMNTCRNVSGPPTNPACMAGVL